jgi:Rap1a immunity proteins
MCLGYVAGISDSLNVNRAENDFTSCTSPDITTGQTADVVLKYLSEHPKTRHLPAAILVTSAISEAFCPPPQPLPEVNYQDQKRF